MRDTNEKRGPASTPDPAHATEASVTAPANRQPGEWPSITAQREKWRREHARRTWAYGVIKEHLAAQPTPGSIRGVARLWCRDITAAADALAQERQNQEHGA
ncbi:hypothetical protein [Streptomyces adustus]|uniref:hypothetical protein n=1 Tax=Streptomyces adustus TaxID=1609272 RepID=UPI003722DBC9